MLFLLEKLRLTKQGSASLKDWTFSDELGEPKLNDTLNDILQKRLEDVFVGENGAVMESWLDIDSMSSSGDLVLVVELGTQDCEHCFADATVNLTETLERQCSRAHMDEERDALLAALKRLTDRLEAQKH